MLEVNTIPNQESTIGRNGFVQSYFILNHSANVVDLICMLTLILFFALKVATPGEMSCIGSIIDSPMPADVYIAGVENEGTVSLATQGQILYLNGPKVPSLKVGEISRVVRPAEMVRDSLTGKEMGVYYQDLGAIRIEAVNRDNAVARVVLSCQGFRKGDLVFPSTPKPMLSFNGELSNKLTQLPENGIVSSILLGKEDIQNISAGQFCFIGRGSRDGVKPGDRFTVFRSYPPFDSKEMSEGTVSSSMLGKRKIPPMILGDIVIVDAGDKVSAGKVINSLSEMHPGDFVVKR
jgi:hypothetical protein